MSSKQAGRKRSKKSTSKTKSSKYSSDKKHNVTSDNTKIRDKALTFGNNSCLENNDNSINDNNSQLISFDTGDLPSMYYGDHELSVASKRLLFLIISMASIARKLLSPRVVFLFRFGSMFGRRWP